MEKATNSQSRPTWREGRKNKGGKEVAGPEGVNEERREREEQASEQSERSACLEETPETHPTD
jgi:hypothetical protein